VKKPRCPPQPRSHVFRRFFVIYSDVVKSAMAFRGGRERKISRETIVGGVRGRRRRKLQRKSSRKHNLLHFEAAVAETAAAETAALGLAGSCPNSSKCTEEKQLTARKEKEKTRMCPYRAFVRHLRVLSGISIPMSVPPELTVFSVKIEQTRGSYAGATRWHRHLFSSDYLGNKL
jgi:hypothetical protein